MKKMFILFGTIALFLMLSCNQQTQQNAVSLDTGWKFNTGDESAWATLAFDDSKWDTLDPKKIWEEQGSGIVN